MRVATWNVNSINARRLYVLDWLDTRRPDIACLQELKVTKDDFPRDDLAALGYHAVVHCQKAWNGVAVVSRTPAELVQAGLPGLSDAGARLVTASVDDILVTSVYVPNGKKVSDPDFQVKLAWLDALRAYVESLSEHGASLVVAGDFNLVPADIDSYHPQEAAGKLFHTEAERDRYRRLVDIGLADVFRETAPDDPGFSWWDYRQGHFHKGLGLRIDLLLASRDLADRVTSVAVDRAFRRKRDGIWEVKPSDHAPVEVILE